MTRSSNGGTCYFYFRILESGMAVVRQRAGLNDAGDQEKKCALGTSETGRSIYCAICRRGARTMNIRLNGDPAPRESGALYRRIYAIAAVIAASFEGLPHFGVTREQITPDGVGSLL